MHGFRTFKRAASTVAVLLSLALGWSSFGIGANDLSNPAAAAASSVGDQLLGAPKAGGTVTVGDFRYQTLDPGSGLWTGSQYGIDAAIYDTLFLPGPDAKHPVKPSLATGYSYSDDFKTLTIDLRHGVSFQDGTPFNAAAVKWNFTRPEGKSTTTSTNFSVVKSVTTQGQYKVVMHFSQPDSIMVYVLSNTGANFIASPTAYKKLGADAFSHMPVGAGPFKVVSDTPAQQLTLQRWPGYWDAGHVYLDSLKYTDVGTSQTTVLDDLASNAIQSYPLLGVTAVPTVMKQAASMSNVVLTKGPDALLLGLLENAQKPPFNNVLVRRAVASCIDRDAIANDVEGGYSKPAPINAGTGTLFYPAGGLQQASRLDPYAFDVGKATALVKKAGGVSFTILAATGQTTVIATALQQDWTRCGMKVTVQSFTGNSFLSNLVDGTYQVALSQGGGYVNPGLSCTSATPLPGTTSAYFYKDKRLIGICDEAKATTDQATLQSNWKSYYQIWAQLAINPPITSSENLYFNNKCLAGTEWIGPGLDFAHAYYACKP